MANPFDVEDSLQSQQRGTVASVTNANPFDVEDSLQSQQQGTVASATNANPSDAKDARQSQQQGTVASVTNANLDTPTHRIAFYGYSNAPANDKAVFDTQFAKSDAAKNGTTLAQAHDIADANAWQGKLISDAQQGPATTPGKPAFSVAQTPQQAATTPVATAAAAPTQQVAPSDATTAPTAPPRAAIPPPPPPPAIPAKPPSLLAQVALHPLSGLLAAGSDLADLSGGVTPDSYANTVQATIANPTQSVRDIMSVPLSAGEVPLHMIAAGAGGLVNAFADPGNSSSSTLGGLLQQAYQGAYQQRNNGLRTLGNDPAVLAGALMPEALMPAGLSRAVEAGAVSKAGLADVLSKTKPMADELDRLAARGVEEEANAAALNARPLPAGNLASEYTPEALAKAAASRDAAQKLFSEGNGNLVSRVASMLPGPVADATARVLGNKYGRAALSGALGAGESTLYGSTDRALNGGSAAPDERDAILGGALGTVGSYLQSRGIEGFPGLDDRPNRKVDPFGKNLVTKNINEILSTGVMPKTQKGFLKLSKDNLHAIAEKAYEPAAVELNRTNASRLTSNVAHDFGTLKSKIITDAARAAGIETSPGVIIPDDERMLVRPDQQRNPTRMRVRAAGDRALAANSDLIKTSEIPGNAAEKQGVHKAKLDQIRTKMYKAINEAVTEGNTENKLGEYLNKELGQFSQQPFRSTEMRDLTKAAYRQLRGILEDSKGVIGLEGRELANGGVRASIPEDVKKAFLDERTRILGDVPSTKDQTTRALSPAFLQEQRTKVTNPQTYADPVARAALTKKAVSQAWHEAINEQFEAWPEYKQHVTPEMTRKYALWKSLQDIVTSPGNLGLASRAIIDVPGLPIKPNAAMDHWWIPSASYKTGSLLQRALGAVAQSATKPDTTTKK